MKKSKMFAKSSASAMLTLVLFVMKYFKANSHCSGDNPVRIIVIREPVRRKIFKDTGELGQTNKGSRNFSLVIFLIITIIKI